MRNRQVLDILFFKKIAWQNVDLQLIKLKGQMCKNPPPFLPSSMGFFFLRSIPVLIAL